MTIRQCLTVAVGVVLAFSIGLVQAAEREAYLKSMVGTVKVRKGESPIWKDGRPNMVLKEKDAVRTFVESQVEIMTAEGSTIRLDENTTLEIAALKEFGGGAQTSSIRILNGTVLANVKKLVNVGSTFQFETPTAVASIRGTSVGFDVTGDKTLIKVYEGEVMVVPKGAQTGVSIKSNQMTTVVKGQKIVRPEQLAEPAKTGAADTARRDTARTPAPDSTGKSKTLPDSSGLMPLRLNLLGPQDNTNVKPGAQISVSGTVTPSSAKVSVGGTAVPVSQSGDFKTTIAAPQAPGDYDLTIEASNGAQSQSSVRRYSVASSAQFFLSVTSPADGQKFGQPLIPVSGTTAPGAEVTVAGVKCQVAGDGSFSAQVPIPDEETRLDLEIDASYNGQTARVTRQITYQAAITISVAAPQDNQVVTSTSVQVSGQVLPSTADLLVNDTKISLGTNGKFGGSVTIPDEEGQVSLTFEVESQGVSKTLTRTITYKRPLDNVRPQITPASMPQYPKTPSIPFTVTDLTPDDEVTFYKIADGAQETETGSPNSSFKLDLQEGTHSYTVYAEDKARNRSNTVTGTVQYLYRKLAIQMRKPIGTDVIRIPPGHPLRTGEIDDAIPTYTVQFQIYNVPDNDRSLVKSVTVKNLSNGQSASMKDLFDLEVQVDIRLSRGQNRIEVDVLDINNNVTVGNGVVEVQ